MITTSERRRPSFLTIALVLSLVAHLVLVLLYLGFLRRWLVVPEPLQKPEMVAMNDMITVEKRHEIPRLTHRAVPHVVQPKPQPQAVQPQPVRPQQVQPRTLVEQPVPKALPTAAPTPAQHRELARIVPHAAPEPRTVVTAPPAEETEPRHDTVAAAPPSAGAPKKALSSQQMAQLQSRFEQTIAQANADLTTVKPPKKPPETMKKYAFVMSGVPSDLLTAQGYVDPRERWVDPVTHRHWYYIHVRVVWDDGTAESVDIPWPVSFPSDDDPIETGQVFHHIPDPPPGFQLPHPFSLSRLLCMYYRKECQAVIDHEQATGASDTDASVLTN